MKIKDKLFSWYIQNVLIPKTEEINHPGFLITNLTGSTGNITVREIGFPEKLFVELEERVISSRHFA